MGANARAFRAFWLFLLALSTTNANSINIKSRPRSIIAPSLISLSVLLNGNNALAAAQEQAPKLGTCATESNPQATTIWCRELGLDKDQRLRGCNANENCISTSATAATKRGAPWTYPASQSASQVFLQLKASCELQGLKVLQAKEQDMYILAAQKNVPKQPAGASLFYEFKLKPEDNKVLYRAVVDKSVFIYPLQQPVSDFDALRNTLEEVRQRAGLKGEQQNTLPDEYL